VVNRLSRRYDEIFLEQLTEFTPLDDETKNNQEILKQWLKDLESKLNQGSSKAVFTIELDYKETEDFSIVVNKKMHGVTKTFVMQDNFFNSRDYKSIAAYADDTLGLFDDNSYVQLGERKRQVSSFKQAFDWMMREVKKGQHIQRYKGLGEMNPDQLFETTLDPNSRIMLQVTIEDAIAADEIFTTLMGDVVEPRRDFIVKHALDVANLDI
jgi:DNA gyrase subunit B